MTDYNHEPLSQPRERAFPFPEDQLGFEAQFTGEYQARFPDAVPLLEGAMAALHRATGIPDSPLKKLEGSVSNDKEQPVTGEEREKVNELLNQPLSPTRMTTIELTMPTEPKQQASPQERYRSQLEQALFVLEADMPHESRALLDGLYGLIGAQVLRNDHDTGQQEGNVLVRGTYMGQVVYFSEEFRRLQPSQSQHSSIEPQEALKLWSVGEAEALNILHK